MSAIDIKRVNDQVVFEPPNLVVAANEIIFWRNWDPKEAHWITPKGATPNTWFRYPLARFVAGQPPDTTPALVVQGGAPINYECSIHKESGTITFVELGSPHVA